MPTAGNASPAATARSARAPVAAAALAALLLAVAPACAGRTLPGCESKEVLDILLGIPPLQAILASGAQFSEPKEAAFDVKEPKRSCTGLISRGAQRRPIEYSVKWHDREKGQVWVSFTE
jgi:hypothetical protein